MILIGRNLSPFVRRTVISLRLLEIPFEQRSVSLLKDLPEVLKVNPQGRVPVLILDDGEKLVDSSAILDYLDELAGPEAALVPVAGPARRAALRLIYHGHCTAEKTVQGFYERTRRPEDKRYDVIVERTNDQARAGLNILNDELGDRDSFGGDRVDQVDITTVVVHDFVATVNPDLLENGTAFPNLARLSARMNERPEFAETQPSV